MHHRGHLLHFWLDCPHKINLYLSSSFDYLRPGEGVFVGQPTSSTTVTDVTSFEKMPKILAPVLQVGDEPQFRALHSQGKHCGQKEDIAAVNDAPLLECKAAGTDACKQNGFGIRGVQFQAGRTSAKASSVLRVVTPPTASTAAQWAARWWSSTTSTPIG